LFPYQMAEKEKYVFCVQVPLDPWTANRKKLPLGGQER
jgi:hypothetical protein